ncbi:MAG: hypothetical protein JKY96_04565 [Phycisphaerales bacterium]|nr:hypothetical protein [Phycisphaerales bacterium]
MNDLESVYRGLWSGWVNMSEYRTLSITRSKARETLVRRVLDMSEVALEKAMKAYLSDKLCNCNIVADGDDNNDDEV